MRKNLTPENFFCCQSSKTLSKSAGMPKFTTLKGVAAPLDIQNIDTDMIIPKQYLKTIKRSGLGVGLFSEMRYLDQDPTKLNPGMSVLVVSFAP